jgi:anti-sigma factor RsiW
MNPHEHLQPEELLAYLLEQLPPAEMDRVRLQVETCAQCADELESVRVALGEFAAAAAPAAELPRSARDRFLSRLKQDGKQSAAHEPRATVQAIPLPPPRRASLAWTGWLAAAALLILLLGSEQSRRTLTRSLAESRSREEISAQPLLRSLTQAGVIHASLTEPKTTAQPSARLVYAPQTGAVLLLASHLRPLPSDKVYELWLIPSQPASAPLGAGTFRVNASGEASLLLPTGLVSKHPKAFGVTVEASGGSQAPTSPIVLAGAAGE